MNDELRVQRREALMDRLLRAVDPEFSDGSFWGASSTIAHFRAVIDIFVENRPEVIA